MLPNSATQMRSAIEASATQFESRRRFLKTAGTLMLALGHPILGDGLYAPDAVRERAPRLLLHACALELAHPATGEALRWCSPAPF